MNFRRFFALLVANLLSALPLIGQDSPSPGWERKETNDALHKLDYSQFILRGKYIVPPKRENPAPPLLVARCKEGSHRYGNGTLNGKFLSGYLVVDAVLDFKQGAVPVEYRLDDGKLQNKSWSSSTDGSGAFFDVTEFDTLIYAHFMPHKENTNPPVRRIIVGVPEYLGAQIQVQFYMPDPAVMAEACGVVLHKR